MRAQRPVTVGRSSAALRRLMPMRNGFEDLDLDRLRRRRSEKWRLHPPDVLPAFIAEMDYDMAEPVLAPLRTALDLSDCGYAAVVDIGETFAAFAAARHGWTVDPGRVHLVPDVMAGFDAILALATEPGDGVVINPPVYPPFFKHIGFDGRRVVEVPLIREGDRWELDFAGLEAAFAAGARAYLLCNPHNPTGRVFSPADLDRIAALAERYDVRVGAHPAAARPAAGVVPLRGRAVRRAGLAGRVELGRGLAGRAARAAGPRAGRVRPSAGRAAARGPVCPAGGELPGLGGLRGARPWPGTGRGVPGPRPGGARPRARLRRAGRRVRPGHHRHQQRAAVRHRGPDGGGRGLAGAVKAAG